MFFRRRLFTNLPVLILGLLMPLGLLRIHLVDTRCGLVQDRMVPLVQSMAGAYGAAGPIGFMLLVSGFAVLLGVRRMRVVPVESLDVRDEMSMLELPAPRSQTTQGEGEGARGQFRPPLSPWG